MLHRLPRLTTLTVLTSVLVANTSAQQPSSSIVTAYENGRWFTGSAFESRTMYVEGDEFVERPERTDVVVDLDGSYVVPPFGEAHNHNVDSNARLQTYMRAGVFYVQNPNNLPSSRTELAGLVNRPGAPDVSFANGGITGPGGHPIGIVRRNIDRGLWTGAEGEGAFLFSVPDTTALDRAWPALLASRPNVVKVYLLYSEHYAARLTDPATVGWCGLDPDLVPDVVRRARESGLRVIAHVESAADFHVAVTAGVDQVAHMPGFRGDEKTALPDPSRYRISEADAVTAGRKGIVVVTTLAALAGYAADRGDAALGLSVEDLNRANLAVLLKAGVLVAVGSDAYEDTSVREALYLARLGVLDHAALLRSWSEVTPRAIFPGRQIGRLVVGYEASFLVLDGDPLADFTNVTRVRTAVKQGQAVILR